MTLDEMLALLPDNTAGEISAADLRSIVSDLYDMANTVGDSFAYLWSTSGGAPGSGHCTMDQPWQAFATKMLVSETANDGIVTGWTVVDTAVSAKFWVTTAAGSKLTGEITGPSLDMGTYREVPIHVASITGAQPGNNAAVTLTLAGVVG